MNHIFVKNHLFLRLKGAEDLEEMCPINTPAKIIREIKPFKFLGRKIERALDMSMKERKYPDITLNGKRHNIPKIIQVSLSFV